MTALIRLIRQCYDEKRLLSAEEVRGCLARLPDSDVNRRDGYGVPALHRAVQYGFDEAVEALLEDSRTDLTVRVAGDQASALHFAAEYGQYRCAELLVKHDKSLLEMEAVGGATPMESAVYHGHTNILRLFLNKGADPSHKSNRALKSATQQNKQPETDILKSVEAMNRLINTCAQHAAKDSKANDAEKSAAIDVLFKEAQANRLNLTPVQLQRVGFHLWKSGKNKYNTEAAQFTENAAMAGNVEGLCDLAYDYCYGQGRAKDLIKAIYYHQQAALKSCSNSLNALITIKKEQDEKPAEDIRCATHLALGLVYLKKPPAEAKEAIQEAKNYLKQAEISFSRMADAKPEGAELLFKGLDSFIKNEKPTDVIKQVIDPLWHAAVAATLAKPETVLTKQVTETAIAVLTILSECKAEPFTQFAANVALNRFYLLKQSEARLADKHRRAMMGDDAKDAKNHHALAQGLQWLYGWDSSRTPLPYQALPCFQETQRIPALAVEAKRQAGHCQWMLATKDTRLRLAAIDSYRSVYQLAVDQKLPAVERAAIIQDLRALGIPQRDSALVECDLRDAELSRAEAAAARNDEDRFERLQAATHFYAEAFQLEKQEKNKSDIQARFAQTFYELGAVSLDMQRPKSLALLAIIDIEKEKERTEKAQGYLQHAARLGSLDAKFELMSLGCGLASDLTETAAALRYYPASGHQEKLIKDNPNISKWCETFQTIAEDKADLFSEEDKQYARFHLARINEARGVRVGDSFCQLANQHFMPAVIHQANRTPNRVLPPPYSPSRPTPSAPPATAMTIATGTPGTGMYSSGALAAVPAESVNGRVSNKTMEI